MARVSRRPAMVVVSACFILTTAIVSAPSTSGASAACPAVQFVGVRGSSEPPGFGATINVTLTEFKNRIKKSFGSHALVYPASPQPIGNMDATIPQFKASVEQGTNNLVGYLKTQSSKCPSQQFVLAGYSQGAMVVDRALFSSSASIQKKVAAVTLFGDPRFDPSFAGNQGTFNKSEQGIIELILPNYGGAAYMPALVSGKTQSYCIAKDPICNFSIINSVRCLTNEATCPHVQYIAKGWTGKAGWYLSSKVN